MRIVPARGTIRSERRAVFVNQTQTGALIRALRLAEGMTQAALAQALGVSDKAVSKWENGGSQT